MNVQVVRDHDRTYSGGDFLRVYCQRRDGTATTFTTIERVFGGELHTSTWYFRTLVSEAPMDPETATHLAQAYASRKNIPVVYVEVE